MRPHNRQSQIRILLGTNPGEAAICTNLTGIKEIQTLTQQATQTLDGLIPSLAKAPTTPLSDYVPGVEQAYWRLKNGIGRSPDILLRKIRVPACPQGSVLVACVDGLSDSQMVDQDIIAPLLTTTADPKTWDETTLTPVHVSKGTQWSQITADLATGNTLIITPDLPYCWIVDTVKIPQRAIERPQTELTVRGPEEAFNEILLTQMNQLRRRFLDNALQFHPVTIGRLQHTKVAVTYIEGITNPELVKTAIDRLSRIAIDSYANSTLIAGLIRDHPHSIFPTIRATERVDVAVWRLNEGKIVMLVDGDPFVLIAPAPLSEFYRTAMDYTGPWYDATFVRLIRFAGWSLGIYLPAVYIAVTEVDPSLVPSALLIIILGDHAGLPFPPIVEVSLMIFVVEILREAALRLPKILGTTIGTVGAIVVGTAVVKAGLVSPQIIVLMTLTALSFFSAPVYELTGTWRLIGFVMLAAAFLLGMLGIIVASVVMIAELTTMSSFGVPYLTPWTPFRWKDWKDHMVRMDWTLFKTRPVVSRSLKPTMRSPGKPSASPHLYQRQRE